MVSIKRSETELEQFAIMTNFPLVFAGALLWNVLITFRSSDYYKRLTGSASTSVEQQDPGQRKKWVALLNRYMLVYLLATCADWLQGPYVYALYADYGYTQHDIAVLFVAGFGSSMVFGSFIGGMADWGGRRTFVIFYAVVYAASCFTKRTCVQPETVTLRVSVIVHRSDLTFIVCSASFLLYSSDFKDFNFLMFGRLLGGVATSLLFSIFEAWLIRAHADEGVRHYLSKSFSWAAYGNSIVAIVAGLVANKAAASNKMETIGNQELVYIGGYLNPFDISFAALVLCGLFAGLLWEENFGDSTSGHERQSKWYDGLKNAFVTTIRSQDILLCGLCSSLYEGSMYIFVFMWTPAITEVTDASKYPDGLPFGLIFSTFMVCCMAGSSCFSILVERIKVEKLAAIIFACAAVSMGLIGIGRTSTVKFLAMNLFEMTVGMYFPTFGTLKGVIVPESKRAAIYNLYRIPLNFIVLFSLLTDLTPTMSFALNCIMLSTATVLQVVLMKRREMMGQTPGDDDDETAGLVKSQEMSDVAV